jgi:hypothetical protein
MRFVKYLCLLLCAFSVIALAAENKMGIREVNRVNFQTPIQVGAISLPAGEYVVRHTMEGENHVMVFQLQKSNREEFKVKCTLVPLEQKAAQSQTIYEVKGNDRVLQELVFRGDTAKHVF